MGSRLEKKSNEIRKRIEGHQFADEEGDEYGASRFGGFPEYFRRKKIKLQNLDSDRRAQSDKPPIFRGIVAHVNGYTQPSLNDLHDMIVAHGGGFIQYLDGKTMVTHMIASSLTPKKVVEFRKYRIVKPAWIVDSIKAGRLLPWAEYRVVDEGAGQKLLGFDNGQLSTQINDRKHTYKEQSSTSWYNSQLKGKKPEVDSSRQTPPDAPAPNASQDTVIDGDVSFSLSDVDQLERSIPQFVVPRDTTQKPSKTFDEIESSSQGAQETLDLVTNAPDYIPDGDQADGHAPPSPAPSDPAETVPSRGLKRSATTDLASPNKAAKLTAEEHNSILLADPRIRKSTVVNPDFLEQYYRESRLHHLSTWKADLKSKLQAMTAEQTSSQKATNKRPVGSRRYVMHVDFDSFFVAVSLKKSPHLRDKPAVVAHGAGSGSEIASCNYPARTFGVKNGMWMRTAQVLCPDLVVLPYDFPAYEDASRKFYDAILATGGIVQSVSVDEALIDISAECVAASGTDGVKRSEGATYREQATADQLAQDLRQKVLEATGCNVSIGIGANILLAKVALRKAKPAGQFQLKPDDVLDFIGVLEVQNLPGVAHSLGSKLEEIGIKYVKDIRDCTREKLTTTLGPKTGEKLWDYARGIDRTEVGDQVIRKSVSAEVNWGVRFENQEQVDEFLTSLCGELSRRLVKERVKGRQVTVKIMRRSTDAPLDPPKFLGHGKCDVYNKSVQLGVATVDAALFIKDVLAILRTFGFTPGELRGIGLQVTKLEPIKGAGPADSSQRRLQFKLDQTTKPAGESVEERNDPIEDVPHTPKKPRVKDIVQSSVSLPTESSPSKKPLNIAGTQFALPTQVDPQVLAELPADIRARLLPRQSDRQSLGEKPKAAETAAIQDRATPPSIELPNRSQLDAETLAALPPEVRAEVLALYDQVASEKPQKAGIVGQTILPQSPRKNRTLPASKLAAASKRGRSNLFTSIKRSLRSNTDSTLTQSNFVARVNTSDIGSETDDADHDLDADFLAALPSEVRQEVLDQHRQARLRRAGGIDLSLHARHRGASSRGVRAGAKGSGSDTAKGHSGPSTTSTTAMERLFRLPPRKPTPVFTNRKLSDLPDLRKAVSEWVAEFSSEEPFAEDVGALAKYLASVVCEERDMAKAVRVVKWLVWSVEREGERNWLGTDEIMRYWGAALGEVKKSVQDAVQSRGLGSVAS